MKNILAIDIGNTTAHFGLFNRNRLTIRRDTPTADILRGKIPAAITHLFAKDNLTIVLASVQPSALRNLKKIIHLKNARVVIVQAGKDFKIPLKNSYRKPRELGIDRLLAAYAAYSLFGKNRTDALVVNCGTAITFDYVTRTGCYRGGAIAPGVGLAAEALHQKTAQLPFVRPDHSIPSIGQTTRDCLTIGLGIGIGGLCDRIIKHLTPSNKKVLIVATGGDAPLIAKYSNSIRKIKSDLVLHGLRLAYEKVIG